MTSSMILRQKPDRHSADRNPEPKARSTRRKPLALFSVPLQLIPENGLATGRVRQPGELADTEWANERGATVDVDDRSGGTIRLPNVPWRFSDSPGVAVSGVPKFRGEDNRTILADLLGYDEERLDALEADGVLSSRIPK